MEGGGSRVDRGRCVQGGVVGRVGLVARKDAGSVVGDGGSALLGADRLPRTRLRSLDSKEVQNIGSGGGELSRIGRREQLKRGRFTAPRRR